MEENILISVKMFKSLKLKNDDAAQKLLVLNSRIAAKKIIDKMNYQDFEAIFKTEVTREGQSIKINVKLKNDAETGE